MSAEKIVECLSSAILAEDRQNLPHNEKAAGISMREGGINMRGLSGIVLFLLLLTLSLPVSAASSPKPVGNFWEGQKAFETAWENYARARQSLAEPMRSNAYADAVAAVSRATAAEPDNADYLILASQIYRGKGGLSYAKDYFVRAEKIILDKMAENPDNIGLCLDYAIICRAGDVRFWKDADKYQKKAETYADKVIKFCNDNKNAENRGRNLRAVAIANLVKGNIDKCEKLLRKASSMDDTNRFYYEIFLNTVGQKKWLWPTKAYDREFLIYILTDSSRNANLR